jgi:hypothetical protein
MSTSSSRYHPVSGDLLPKPMHAARIQLEANTMADFIEDKAETMRSADALAMLRRIENRLNQLRLKLRSK